MPRLAHGAVFNSVKKTLRPQRDVFYPLVDGDVASNGIVSFSPNIFAWKWQRTRPWDGRVLISPFAVDMRILATSSLNWCHTLRWLTGDHLIWNCWTNLLAAEKRLALGPFGFFLTKHAGWDATASHSIWFFWAVNCLSSSHQSVSEFPQACIWYH